MKLKLFFLCLITCVFVGCFDITDTITINNDGSGLFEQKMDLSRVMTSLKDMMHMAGKSGKNDKNPEKKDSIIYYKNIVDTIKSLTDKEKAVLRNAYAKLHIDEAEGEMVVNIFYPFKNSEEFNIIQEVNSRKNSGANFMEQISNAIKADKTKGLPKLDDSEGEVEDEAESLPSSNYRYTLMNNKITRTLVNGEDFMKEDAVEDMPEQIKEIMKLSYTTLINLPKAANNFYAKNGSLSSDKKVFTVTKQMEITDKMNQDDFDFNIDFN